MCFRPAAVSLDKKCEKCGATNDASATTCSQCGAELPVGPAMPGAPGAPGTPKAPGVPAAPGAPATPTAPETPQ